MTEQMAIKIIKQEEQWESNSSISKAFIMAIQALEEIQQIKEAIKDFPLDCGSTVSDVKEIYRQLREYLKIGSVEELQALKEKSVAKKPRFYAHNYYCTECGGLVGNNEFKWQRFLYCDKCGTKIDWE